MGNVTLSATPDGRMFVRQFHPHDGELAAAIDVRGKLVSTIGPDKQHRDSWIKLSAAGSLAVLVNSDQNKPQVIVTGPDGKPRFSVDSSGRAEDLIATPDGQGVLLGIGSPADGEVTFQYFIATGEVAEFSLGPEARFLCWLPSTRHAVFSSSIRNARRYRLVDCETGKWLCDIPEPVSPFPGVACSTLLVEGYLLIGGSGYVAIETKEGRVAARWTPDEPHQHYAWLTQYEGRLLVVSKDIFTEFGIEDIKTKDSGWR